MLSKFALPNLERKKERKKEERTFISKEQVDTSELKKNRNSIIQKSLAL